MSGQINAAAQSISSRVQSQVSSLQGQEDDVSDKIKSLHGPMAKALSAAASIEEQEELAEAQETLDDIQEQVQDMQDQMSTLQSMADDISSQASHISSLTDEIQTAPTLAWEPNSASGLNAKDNLLAEVQTQGSSWSASDIKSYFWSTFYQNPNYPNMSPSDLEMLEQLTYANT